jgi:hypothetical protein
LVAWLIVARDWGLMAEREEAKLNAAGGEHDPNGAIAR